MHRGIFAWIALQPRLLGCEAQHRREPCDGAAEQLIDHSQRRLARHRRVRIAVERVLAHVEIERREIDCHELAERREDALVVELPIGLSHQHIQFGEPVQHQPLELGHLLHCDAILDAEVHEVAEHPADGVAQLAIGIDRGLDDFRPDADVVGVIRRAHPHAQDVGAGLLHHVLRRNSIAERLRHLARRARRARSRGSARRRTARRRAYRNSPAARNGTSRDAGRSLPDTSRCRARRPSCGGCPRDSGNCRGSSSVKAWVEPESNQTSRMSSTFCHGSLARPPRKRSRAPSAYQASAPSASNASPMRWLTSASCRISTEPSPFSRTNTAIGTPQARWREITQSGRLWIMPVMRFSPCGGTQRVALDRVQCAVAQRVVALGIAVRVVDVLVHRDEPLRRIAEDDRLLRAPGMRDIGASAGRARSACACRSAP